jgi:hypothetical protein
VKWGFNTYGGYAGADAVLRQAAAGCITAITDPTLTVVTGA